MCGWRGDVIALCRFYVEIPISWGRLRAIGSVRLCCLTWFFVLCANARKLISSRRSHPQPNKASDDGSTYFQDKHRIFVPLFLVIAFSRDLNHNPTTKHNSFKYRISSTMSINVGINGFGRIGRWVYQKIMKFLCCLMMMLKEKVMRNLEKIENARQAGVGVSRQVFGNIPMTEVLSKQVGFSFPL